jgi:hypothetical protein
MVETNEPLHLRGAPRSVRGFVAMAQSEIGTSPAVVFDGLARDRETFDVQTVPRGGHTELRVALPESTAPGEYRGTVQLGERRFPVIAQVDARMHLACIPPQIELTSGHGRRLRETLTIVNDGNVTAIIEKHYGFGLFETSGLDRAIRTAFEAHATKARAGSETMFEAAAEEYGGVAAASVADGVGPLEPGHSRRVTLSFRLSEKANRRAAYFGYLSIVNLTIPVLVRNADYSTREAAL